GLEIEEQLVVDRLIKAAVEPDVRRDMDVEDEILSEIESRDTTIMMKNKELELKNKELESKSQELESKSQELESKSQELESKSQELISKNKMLGNMISLLRKQGLSDEDIAKELNIGINKLSEYV
ncbi:hypothetical protein OCV82_04650, partial [Bacteroides cellulolyticus]|nr:hypothetical protein [Bacteroides cellulolyticus]